MTSEITPWIACDGKNVPDFGSHTRVDYVMRDGTTDSEIEVQWMRQYTMLFDHVSEFRGDIMAWRPSASQGLMSKPTQGNVILDPMGNEYRLTNTSDKPVTISFGGSSHPVEVHVIPAAEPEMTDEEIESEERFIAQSVRGSDEPGIAAMAAPAKQPDGPTIIYGVTVDPVAFEAFLDSQRPKPIPNMTPRGILTVFNERADHRLGMWQEMME